jgi:DNA-binding phage protein
VAINLTGGDWQWLARYREALLHNTVKRILLFPPGISANTVAARVERDPAFAQALLDEAATLFLADEPETARLILRDLVNATLGFEQLAKLTDLPSKSLHRRLSPKDNPSKDNLAAIFGVRYRSTDLACS